MTLLVQSSSNISLISTKAMFLHLWKALGSASLGSGIIAVDGNSDDQDSGASWWSICQRTSASAGALQSPEHYREKTELVQFLLA